jgi:hypothetical protein
MEKAGVLTILGLPMSTTAWVTSIGAINNSSLKTGWNLIGCPFQTATLLSTLFTVSNTIVVKNFDGFWFPNGTLNSITAMNSGKAYFMRKK